MAPTRKTTDKATDVAEEVGTISKSEFESFKAAQEEQISSLREMLQLLLDRSTQPPAAPAKDQGPNDVVESSQGDHRNGKAPEEEEDNVEVCDPTPLSFTQVPNRRHYERGGFHPRQEEPSRQGFNIPPVEDLHFGVQTRGDPRIRKLEMPVFNGDNVNEWIYKAERYFRANGFADHEALVAATMCLEDKAFKWYAWHNKMQPFTSWGQLKDAIIERFQGMDSMDIYEHFFSITQDKSVMEYREKFEELAGAIDNVPPHALLANFLRGLKKEIRDAVKIQQPYNLHHAMHLAQLVEGRESNGSRHASHRGFRPDSQFHPHPHFEGNQRPHFQEEYPRPRPYEHRPPPQEPRPAPSEHRPVPNKAKETACYRCFQPWTPGHTCTKQAVRVMEVQGDECDKEQVALNSVALFTTADAMKLKGRVKGKPVTVLIDSGATHNFISPKLVRKGELRVIDKGEFKVTLGTGHIQTSRGSCPRLNVKLGKSIINTDFLQLPLGGTDIILGMKWLKTLGDTMVNWGKHTMEFTLNGKRVRLEGNPSHTATKVAINSIIKENQSQARKKTKARPNNQVPKHSRAQSVQHIPKSARGPPKKPRQDLEKTLEGQLIQCHPEALQGVRDGPKGREVLIKWDKMRKATWELAGDIEAMFPFFDLEDKIGLWGAGPDVSPNRTSNDQGEARGLSHKYVQMPKDGPAQVHPNGPKESHKYGPKGGEMPNPSLENSRASGGFHTYPRAFQMTSRSSREV